MFLAGFLLQLYGFFGLYGYLTHGRANPLALPALALRSTGLPLLAALFVFLTVDVPVLAALYQQGNQDVLAVFEGRSSGLGMIPFAVGATAMLFGVALFLIAMWRDGRLPRWAIVVFGLSVPLLADAFTFASELLGSMLYLVSTIAIAAVAWWEPVI